MGEAILPFIGEAYYPQMSDNTTAVTTGHTGDSESISERKGIPKAVFMEDVDAYMKANNFSTLMEAGRSFEELYQKYKLIEQALLQRKLRLMQQLPDIQKTLAVVHQLQKKDSDLDVTFEVSSQLFARAHIPKADRVGLWLGANVMLEYDLEEADKILVENEQSAKQSLQDVDQTLEFLKEQTTTVEVNLARIHNLSVKRGRLNKAGAVST
ncbi:prefoldin subunit [Opisthorchis viverrini]|uniref:Prefoldin subunit 3 n=1 Tax=Opisthorchis viverrini TaxID=6198 RepID=A0A1S8X7W3_OPIVI|nr:prefoldin subunit [Opisthorchis viverrini]